MLTIRPMRARVLAGVLGPAIFLVATLMSAALRPGYRHVVNVISELGATGTPYAALMNYGGFLPAGLMLTAFGIVLARGVPRSGSALVGAGLVALFGLGLAASGIFSCDPGCPQSGGSLENFIHAAIAPVMFVGLIAGIAILGLHFRRQPRWRHLAAYSLLTSALALLFMIALIRSFDTRTLSGLWQRLMIGTLFLWCVVVGLAARRNADA